MEPHLPCSPFGWTVPPRSLTGKVKSELTGWPLGDAPNPESLCSWCGKCRDPANLPILKGSETGSKTGEVCRSQWSSFPCCLRSDSRPCFPAVSSNFAIFTTPGHVFPRFLPSRKERSGSALGELRSTPRARRWWWLGLFLAGVEACGRRQSLWYPRKVGVPSEIDSPSSQDLGVGAVSAQNLCLSLGRVGTGPGVSQVYVF